MASATMAQLQVFNFKLPSGTTIHNNVPAPRSTSHLYEVSVQSGLVRERRVGSYGVRGKGTNSDGLRRISRGQVRSAAGAGTGEEATATLEKRAVRSPFLNGPQKIESRLDPSLPGFKNWDPLHLAESNEDSTMSLTWLPYAELMHGRWAMLGAAGVITPELLGRWGVIPDSTAVPWFVSGGLFAEDWREASNLLYAAPFVNKDSFAYWASSDELFWSMIVLMGFVEARRYADFKSPGSMGKQKFLGLEAVLGGSGDPKYPGGQFFNLFGLGQDPKKMATYKAKEINNGRLAMMAMVGFGAQAVVTQKGPIENFYDVFLSLDSIPTLASTGTATELEFLFTLVAVAGIALQQTESNRVQTVSSLGVSPVMVSAASSEEEMEVAQGKEQVTAEVVIEKGEVGRA